MQFHGGRRVLVVLVALFLSQAPAEAKTFSESVNIEPHARPVPPIVFHDENGVEHALSDYRGRFVLLNLWASWCTPCRKEMRSLEQVQKLFDPQKLLVLPLSEDAETDTVQAFYAAQKLTLLPIARDVARHAPSIFGIRGLPTTVLIDPSGQDIMLIEGSADWAAPDALAFLSAQTGLTY